MIEPVDSMETEWLSEGPRGDGWTLRSVTRARGDRSPDPIQALVRDPLGQGVFVSTRVGKTRLWDPVSARVVKDYPRLFSLADVTSDGALLVAIDAGGSVAALDRVGNERWNTSVADPPPIDGTRLVFRDAVLVSGAEHIVISVWFQDERFGVEWEDPLRETRYVERVLAVADGARISSRESHGADFTEARARIRLAHGGSRGQRVAGGQVVPAFPSLGRPERALLSPDQRMLLVGTSHGALLRYDRA